MLNVVSHLHFHLLPDLFLAFKHLSVVGAATVVPPKSHGSATAAVKAAISIFPAG